ncbi:MAG: hypothetical protein WC900_04165 [Oscillospiraceae bacterium]|jgi:hypothetical protein
MVKKNNRGLIIKMNRDDIKKISLQKLSEKPINEIKNILQKNYEISYGNYESSDLIKAINEKTPFYVNNYFVIGYDPKIKKFISDDNQFFPIERMVKAVIIEDVKESEPEDIGTGDPFVIIGKREWTEPITEFEALFGNIRVGSCLLPPHSAVFHFMKPDKDDKKEKIVSCLRGINIEIYQKDNYIDNSFHEIGHLYWRDIVSPYEKKRFENLFKLLRPSALFEYSWEHHDAEEVFCTLYKWYMKGVYLNKAFMNIFEFEEPQGLALLQSVFDRVRDEKIHAAEWAAKQDELNEYFNPRKDPRGRIIQRPGIAEDLEGLTVPSDVMAKAVETMQDGIVYVRLNDVLIPTENNKVILDRRKAKR